MPKTRGKLKPDDEYRLQANYSFMIEEIDAQYLLSELFSKFVIDADDKEKILSKPTTRERTQLLLDILLNSGPGEAYSNFVEVLEEKYSHVAAILKGTEVKDTLRRHYTWYEEIPNEVKNRMITDADASRISTAIGDGWRDVMLRLEVSKVEIEQELFNHQHDTISNIITYLLIKWRQRLYKQATVDSLVSVLKEVDEAGSCTIAWEIVEKALKKGLPQS
ncbi:hypothetical protein BsWGS_13449 [Bradybaena similaris]